MAEQFAFGQRFGQGGTVHMHQRFAAAPRLAMHAMREQFLADAGFAQQQDGQFGVRHHLDLVQQAGDGLALPEDLAVIGQRAVGRQRAAGHA